MKACIRCGIPFAPREDSYQYPANAPLWPWKYCLLCVSEYNAGKATEKIVEVRP